MHRPGGYFRPSEGEKGRKELIRFYRRELARSRSSVRKLAAIRNALSQLEGQTDIFELVGEDIQPQQEQEEANGHSDRY